MKNVQNCGDKNMKKVIVLHKYLVCYVDSHDSHHTKFIYAPDYESCYNQFYNSVNDEYFNPNNMNDSICDEMISQNFGTANSLIRSTTNDYINRLGFKNNVLWSENLYRNKALKFKTNFKKLNIEKPIDTSSCCAACT